MGSDLRRKTGGRTADDYVIVVAYDGEATEDEYFRAWKQIIPFNRLSIQPHFVRSGGNPLKAVKECKKMIGTLDGYAEFWCVCDVDDQPNDVIVKAQELAERHGIRLCLSKRCFEVWMLCHFDVPTSPIGNEQTAITNVQKHLPTFGSPRKGAFFNQLFPLTEDAIENASKLEALEFENSYTKMHHLVRKLHQNLK